MNRKAVQEADGPGIDPVVFDYAHGILETGQAVVVTAALWLPVSGGPGGADCEGAGPLPEVAAMSGTVIVAMVTLLY